MKKKCIKTHSIGLVTKGNIYTVEKIYTCGCGEIGYVVAEVPPPILQMFTKCPCGGTFPSDFTWIGHRLFQNDSQDFAESVLDKISQEREIEKALMRMDVDGHVNCRCTEIEEK